MNNESYGHIAKHAWFGSHDKSLIQQWEDCAKAVIEEYERRNFKNDLMPLEILQPWCWERFNSEDMERLVKTARAAHLQREEKEQSTTFTNSDDVKTSGL
jgi:hypothetical protein